MNNLLTAPIGVDLGIQKMQASLYSFLGSRWSGTIEGFGRAYRNSRKDNDILEWYNAEKADYEDVYYDDTKAAVFFFLLGNEDTTTDEVVFSAQVKGVFMVDLSKILPDSEERADAQAQRDCVEGLRNGAAQFTVTGVERGVNQAFSGFDTEKIKFNDIHPLHCFSVTMTLPYYLTDKCL